MFKDKIAIWGASGHAMVVADIIRSVGEYQIDCFIDNVNLGGKSDSFCGAPVLREKDPLNSLLARQVKKIVFGFSNCQQRLELSNYIKSHGFEVVAAIHPKSVVAADVKFGRGTVICAGVVVNSGVIIAENVILNTSSSIDHECNIGDAASICPGVHLAGKVTIGTASWIGIGSTIIENIRIGCHSYIGAGAVVVRDIPDSVVAYGVPARIVKRLD